QSGAGVAGSINCTGNDTQLTGKDNPFYPLPQLAINDPAVTTNNVSLGYPALSGAPFTAAGSNFSAGANGTYWFGFDPSGKLIPDGKTPYLAANDISALPRFPA